MGYKSTGGSLHQQVYSALQEKQGFGRSKHDDKALGITDQYIYSFDTMRTYMKACNVFVSWAKSQEYIKDQLGHRARTLEECKDFVPAWIKDQVDRGLSAYTIKMRLAAVEKMYEERFDIETPSTARQDITRSRGDVVKDAHFSESKNRDLVNVCQCIGFRRHELAQCKPEQLLDLGKNEFAVSIRGKGGRLRQSPIVGTQEQVASAVAWIRSSTGQNHIPGAMDVHSYRAEYACRVYMQHAQDIETLKGQKIDYTNLTGKTKPDGSHIYKSAVYVCRGDQKGVMYDRRAMILASQALGHNRESVIGEHYLYDLNP